MKVLSKLYLFVILSIFLVFHCSSINTRPVTITVIDNETGKPIENINVFYCLKEMKKKFSLFDLFPFADTSYNFYYSTKLEHTDKNGTVSFSNLNKLNKTYEEHETIFINMNVTKDYLMSVFNSKEPNTNKAYFGNYISNYRQCFDIEDVKNWDVQASTGIDVLIIGGSLNKKEEKIIIRLRKLDSLNKVGKRSEILCNKSK